MIIKVYFEGKNGSELVATFESEDVYLKCVDLLEAIAWANGYDSISESYE